MAHLCTLYYFQDKVHSIQISRWNMDIKKVQKSSNKEKVHFSTLFPWRLQTDQFNTHLTLAVFLVYQFLIDSESYLLYHMINLNIATHTMDT